MHWVLSRADLEELNEKARELAASVHSLWHSTGQYSESGNRALQRTAYTHSTADLPEWLNNALLQVQEPEVFSLGVSGFVTASGRCHETCMPRLSQTPW